VRVRSVTWMVGLLCAWSMGVHGQDVPSQSVSTRRFEITVEPGDERSRDARTVDLFITRDPESGWRLVGPCQALFGENGPRFRGEVTVPADGIYYFVSRAGDAAGKTPAPGREDPPQQCVIVDTMRPIVSLGSPMGDEAFRPGETMTIQWHAADENFPENPIRLDFSENQGQSWSAIAGATANDGEESWIVPATRARAILVRMTATDRAGNRSVATTTKPVRLLPVADAAPAPAPPPPAPVKNDPPLDPKQKFPWMDANDANMTRYDWKTYTPDHDAYTNYIIAGNLVRQGKLEDSLRYYNAAVEKDEHFCDAWNDLGLVYRQLQAYEKAFRCIERAMSLQPENHVYCHTAGEVFQAQGLWLFRTALGDEDQAKAVQAIHQALKYYSRALEKAETQGRLAERGGTYFRIGEICYFVQQDPVGARMYWSKVLSLHTPTPNLDDVMQREGKETETRAREAYQRYTEMAVELQTWQNWARGHLAHLDALERQGLLQPAPHGGEPLDGDMRLVPSEARNPAPPPPPPLGEAPYRKPGYGSEPGDVQRDIPPLPETRSQSRRQFQAWPDPETRSSTTAPGHTQPGYGSQPATTDPGVTSGYANYEKYGGESSRPKPAKVSPPPAASGAGNEFWDYSRRR